MVGHGIMAHHGTMEEVVEVTMGIVAGVMEAIEAMEVAGVTEEAMEVAMEEVTEAMEAVTAKHDAGTTP